MSKPNGVILYSGPSLLDGAPIVAIATGLNAKSTNRKTGAMVQTYILRSNVSPTEAVASGGDKSICGDCRHRGSKEYGANGYVKVPKKRTCYVNVGQGPQAVYRAYRAGKYPAPDRIAGICTGLVVRLGTYGDPAAVPVGVWRLLLEGSTGHTGYTHSWKSSDALRALCMASVDSDEEAMLARSRGWRTFRVNLDRTPKRFNESVCPASAEANKILTCEKCLACSGADGRKGSIVINPHGGFSVMHFVRRIHELQDASPPTG